MTPLDLVKKVAGAVAPGQVTQWFDSILTELGGMSRAFTGRPGPQTSPPYTRTLSQIERVLFLQFLMSEIRFLRAHRLLRAQVIFHKVEHDRMVCDAKQKQISTALVQVFKVQGIDVFDSVLASQIGPTIVAFIAMVAQEEGWPFLPTVEDLLDNRETTAVRKILEKLLDYYSDGDMDFNAHDAWVDLKDQWGTWAISHGKRIQALKKLWAATGGGKVGSNPAGQQAIKEYYNRMYDLIYLADALRHDFRLTQADLDSLLQ
jgi:hypothetical protein